MNQYIKRLEEIPERLLPWYQQNARILPWRENTEPYRVWVSEIMLQQTRVEAVIPFYNRFMERLPDIQALADVPEEELVKLWEGLGYYSRVRNLQKAAQIICREMGGVFPEEYEQMRKLPGIGAYTAGAISSIAFDKPRAAVDGNVLRVVTRVIADKTDITDTAFKERVTGRLEKIYPKGACGSFTQAFMELGAMVCVPNGVPKCEECPLKGICVAYEQEKQLDYPVKKPKAKRRKEDRTVFVLECAGKMAVCKRTEKGLLAGLWELPNVPVTLELQEAMDWLSEQGVHINGRSDIVKEKNRKHIFTHIEWNMSCYRVECSADSLHSANREWVWVSQEQLQGEIALPTAFRKFV